MKTASLALSLTLTCLLSIAHAASTRNIVDAEELMPKLEAALKRDDFSGELTFDELGIQDQREAQGICGLLLGFIDILPDFMECGCEIQIFQLRIVFGCSAELCDIFPEITNTCVSPTYEGILKLNGILTSKVCNDAIPVKLPLGITVVIPEVCVMADHVSGFQLGSLQSCEFSVGDGKCPCSVCENNLDVSVDCTGLRSLGLLAPFANFTCIGLGLIGVGEDGYEEDGSSGHGLFVSPFLSLVSELNKSD
jgi:hypothetical protein